MNNEEISNPWDLVYLLYKGRYTKEAVDDMAMCEIQELLDTYNDNPQQ